MATYVNGKRVKGKITKPIIINVYSDEGVLQEVTTGGFLGTIAMKVLGKIATGLGLFRGKQYPVTVKVNTLGTVPPQLEYRGNHEEELDKQVNALAVIDQDRADKLTPDEQAQLASISTVALHQAVVTALETTPRVWTPFVDACQDADQKLGLPLYHTVPIYAEVEGTKAVGCDVRVEVNGARFNFGEGGYKHCTDGRVLHQFHADAAIGVFPDGELYYPQD